MDAKATNLRLQLLEGLRVFIETFGPIDSDLDLKATVRALLAADASMPAEIEHIDQLITSTVELFRQQQAQRDHLQQLAQTAQSWLKQREASVLEVASAYVQRFSPHLPQSELIDVLQTAVVLLWGNNFSVAEGKSLVHKVLKAFDLDLAQRRWVSPQLLEIAHHVADYRGKADFEADLMAVVWAYLQKFQALLTPQLIQQILKTGVAGINPGALAAGDLQEIAETVFFKVQLLEASPPAFKTKEAIVNQVHQAVQDFQAQRQAGAIDVSQPVPVGDLEVSSQLIVGDAPIATNARPESSDLPAG